MKRPIEYHLQFKLNKYSLFLSKYSHEVKHSCILFVFGSNLWGIGGRALFQFLMHITIRVAPRDSSLGIEIKSYSFTFSSLLTTINTVIQMYSFLSKLSKGANRTSNCKYSISMNSDRIQHSVVTEKILFRTVHG